MPFAEEGGQEMLGRVLANGNLTLSTSPASMSECGGDRHHDTPGLELRGQRLERRRTGERLDQVVRDAAAEIDRGAVADPLAVPARAGASRSR